MVTANQLEMAAILPLAAERELGEKSSEVAASKTFHRLPAEMNIFGRL